MLVEDDFSITFGLDASCRRVFHAVNRTLDGGAYAAVFESQVAIVCHRAVFHHEVMGIAKRLRP